MKIPPEFLLAAACCRWPPSPERDRAVVRAAAGIEWDLFRRIVGRHRIEGLVWEALRRAGVDVPAPVAVDLSAAAAAIARQNLQITSESLQLRQALNGAGIDLLFVKGVTLAALAYDNIGLKSGWDIDLLVPPERLEAGARILEERGYSLLVPEGRQGRERLERWHDHWKESVWRNRRGLHVELHTRLTDNPLLLPGLGTSSPRQEVEVARGARLPTLEREELFAYLCVHGASSAWFRLKWIADVGALLGPLGAEETEHLYRRSQSLGAGRAADQALLLCEFLFGTPLGEGFSKELRSGRINRWLFTAALRKLAGRTVARELPQARLGTATIHLSQLGLLPGLKFKLNEMGRQAVNPYDRMEAPLPPALAFLYPLRAAARHLRQWRSARAREMVPRGGIEPPTP